MIDLEPVSAVEPADPRPLQAKFLEKYMETHSKLKAMEYAGITSLALLDKWAQEDEQFREALAQATGILKDNMEAAAYERAVLGVEKPIYQGKELVGYIREYSDSLLTTMLKANMPEKYGAPRPNALEAPLGGDHGPLPSVTTLTVVHEIGREFGQMLARRRGEIGDGG